MHTLSRFLLFSLLTVTFFHGSCSENENDPDYGDPGNGSPTEGFYFGADLSYVNQILDFGGEFKDEGEVRAPYRIFKDHGANLARFRIWHNPQWTKDIYGAEGQQLYNDLLDVEKSITASKEQELEVLLDFHYSDE
jgi:arabinogalactan endo-1,4-beta-galactosidase